MNYENLSTADNTFIEEDLSASMNILKSIVVKSPKIICLPIFIYCTISIIFTINLLPINLFVVSVILMVMLLLFILYVPVLILKYDRKIGVKEVIQTNDYSITCNRKKDEAYISVLEKPKRKIEIYIECVDHIETWKPLRIEMLPKSKKILCIQHPKGKNLMDVIFAD
jgi:hypothetical protein